MIACCAGLAATATLLAQQPQQSQPGAFRSVVDLIAVDVQVVDGDGNPVGRLGPESFDVTIEGRRHKVVSADFIEQAATGERAAARTIMIAIDSGSFEPGTALPTMVEVRTFIDRLSPEDRVGVYIFPTETWIPPTTQRAAVRAAVGSVVGEKSSIKSQYNLRPSEVVDITAQSTSPNSFLTIGRARAASLDPGGEFDPVVKVQRRECPDDLDCLSKIYREGMMLAVQFEREADDSIRGIETLLGRLQEVPGRKAIVLISGGLLVSDRLDARPEPPAFARWLGQSAARANATVYTIQIEASMAPPGSPASKGAGSSNLSRERALLGNWLDNFSIEAGGRRIYVPVGAGAFAFDRVLRESSAHYLLGVQPDISDRDGLPHKLRVKVDRHGATVRSRQWVVIPKK